MLVFKNDKATTDGLIVKAFGALDVKDETKGEVEAVIATLNTVDREGDVITLDAIKSGVRVAMSAYGHDTVGSLFGSGGAMPVGKGKIIIDENKAVFHGKLFMDTQRGRETLSVLKEMGADQEWSFGFLVIGSEVPDEDWQRRGAERILTKLDCFEVSPVLIGAGVGTRTVAAKEAADADAAARVKAEQEAEAERLRVEAETKAAEEQAVRVKAAAQDAMAEFNRVQRTLKRMGVA